MQLVLYSFFLQYAFMHSNDMLIVLYIDPNAFGSRLNAGDAKRFSVNFLFILLVAAYCY